MNIALLGRDFRWGGGIDLLRLIANALILKSKEHSLNIYFLLPDDKKITHIFDIISLATRVVLYKEYALIKKGNEEFLTLYQDSFRNLDGKLKIIRYYNSKRGLIRCLEKINADVVFPASISLGKDFPVPWIGYFWDFQHKYFPEYFSSDDSLGRDITIATTLKDAKSIVVNSKSVKNDIDKFFPYHKCRVFNLPFAATPINSWFDDPEDNLQKKYALPDNYFVISNQLWIHKSHITAFEALAKIKNKDIHIVCTGNTHDYRFPTYFTELKGKNQQLGIESRVHFLGHIPKIDQINIMKKSIAVIQPTLFEGGPGGGEVYDAVALGIPAIVSDIPINLEIEEENIFFFKSGSFEDMASKMQALLRQDKIIKSKEELLNKGLVRAHKLGDMLLEAINYRINDY